MAHRQREPNHRHEKRKKMCLTIRSPKLVVIRGHHVPYRPCGLGHDSQGYGGALMVYRIPHRK